MKTLENNWRQKSIEHLEKDYWGQSPKDSTPLVDKVYRLRTIQIEKLETKDIRLLIIGKPSKTVIAAGEIHCLVPQTVYMKVPKGKMKSETQLIAVSSDKGTNWYFIDAVNLNKSNIKSVLPNYNFDLILPPKKQPIFIAD